MIHQQIVLSPALYLVATPIGNARDITLRALDVLASAQILSAEDTRTLQRLMQIHGVQRAGRELVAYHDHSDAKVAARLVERIRAGESVVYASEAGTPLVSDPGFELVQAAVAAGVQVVPVPGPSAAITAAMVAGLPTDRLLFLGFPPAKPGARTAWIKELAHVGDTMIFYESPRRIETLLGDLMASFGPDRPAALCRELTKKFEDIRRLSLSELLENVTEILVKGECVLVVGGAAPQSSSQDDIEAALLHALERSSVKDAVAEVSVALGLPRKTVYQIALTLKDKT